VSLPVTQAAHSLPATSSYDVARVRADFPCLSREVHGKPLVYLDSAASAQRPLAVLQAMDDFYRRHNANVHRGVHTLSAEATDLFEQARDRVTAFVNAWDRRGVVFTRGTTEAINLVAQAWARPKLKPGDAVLITHMEHHSNIVPWQLVCEQTGATLKVAPIDERGELIEDALIELLTPEVKLLAMVHVSNALGTINPVARLAAVARARGIATLVDGSQATPHMTVDVQAVGADFYAITGHKMFGPTGIGALIARPDVLEAMPPWHGGGEMIKVVRFSGSTFADIPNRFEAGTPNIAGAIGLGAAAEWLTAVGREAVVAHEAELLARATAALLEVPGLRIIGTAEDKVAVVSFTLEGAHPHDIGTLLDLEGVAVRTGHHCTMPLMEFFQVPATTRASFACYNTPGEVQRLVAAVRKVREILV
jgi:cysteine desulfurase / selenocysteine lyase